MDRLELNDQCQALVPHKVDDILKELHAWACGEYNIAELTGEDERMLAFQDVKRKIMLVWYEQRKIGTEG